MDNKSLGDTMSYHPSCSQTNEYSEEKYKVHTDYDSYG